MIITMGRKNLPRNGNIIDRVKDHIYRHNLKSKLIASRAKGDLGKNLAQRSLDETRETYQYIISSYGHNYEGACKAIDELHVFEVIKNIKKFPKEDHKNIAIYIGNYFNNRPFGFSKTAHYDVNLDDFEGLDNDFFITMAKMDQNSYFDASLDIVVNNIRGKFQREEISTRANRLSCEQILNHVDNVPQNFAEDVLQKEVEYYIEEYGPYPDLSKKHYKLMQSIIKKFHQKFNYIYSADFTHYLCSVYYGSYIHQDFVLKNSNIFTNPLNFK